MTDAIRSMTKSPVALAHTAYEVGKKGLDRYSSNKSRHDFTQAQLFAIMILKQFLKTDYRGVAQMLADFAELRDVLELKKVPHFTTVQKAALRLIKKGLLTGSSPLLSEFAEPAV